MQKIKMMGNEYKKESGMLKGHSLLRVFKLIGLVLILGVSMSACAGLFEIGGDSWKEEVLLHDGSKLIVKRSQTYGGRHEIGQPPPIKEHTITFMLPGSNKAITWTSEYGEDLGRTNFNLLAVHVLNGTPYIVASPNLSLSYNKWGRPNPPYVFFKYDGKMWQRILLEELPTEFKTINVTIYLGGRDVDAMVKQGLVSSENIKERNSELTQPEYKTIVRTPLDAWKPRPPGSNSGRMVRTADGWMGMDWFEDQTSLEACLKLCEQKKISSQDCPCNTLFKGK